VGVIIITGLVAVRAEMREEAVALGRWMAEETERESGCVRYRFYADLADPNLFLLFEEWETEAALRAHFQTPHMARFTAALPGIVGAPPVITRYEISGKGPL
jgi:quinol monooxygenase YgiN